jgi:uncharacterized protein YneF (UPF0154 family)
MSIFMQFLVAECSYQMGAMLGMHIQNRQLAVTMPFAENPSLN